MRRRDIILLLALAVLVYFVVSLFVASPGYMDADYYFVTARQLAAGKGFSEPFIWNYLDNPSGLPHPSHTYWMPLTSLVAAGAMALFGDDFRAAQFPMIVSTVLLPLLAVEPLIQCLAHGVARPHAGFRWRDVSVQTGG